MTTWLSSHSSCSFENARPRGSTRNTGDRLKPNSWNVHSRRSTGPIVSKEKDRRLRECSSQNWSSIRAMCGDDFSSFLFERRDPIVHAHGRTRVRPRRPKIHPGNFKEIAELLISQFEQQLCEETAARFANVRVAKRPSERSA